MHERRNPLSPALERARQAEKKKYGVAHIPDQIYALYYDTPKGRQYIYVGITSDPKRRWGDHQRGMADEMNLKDAYIAARAIGTDRIGFEVLDDRAEFTEAEWVTKLTEQGHTLTNVGSTVDSKRQKKLAELKPTVRLDQCDAVKNIFARYRS